MADDIVKRGWLIKQGRVVKNWKRRFFVLKDGSLAYFERDDDVVPKGELSLYGAAVVYVEPPKIDKEHCIEVSTPSRSLFIHAESKPEIQQWALCIQRAAIIASGGTVVLSSHRIKNEPEHVDDNLNGTQSTDVVVADPKQIARAQARTTMETLVPSPKPSPSPIAAAPTAAVLSPAGAAAVSGAGAGAKKPNETKQSRRDDEEEEEEEEVDEDEKTAKRPKKKVTQRAAGDDADDDEDLKPRRTKKKGAQDNEDQDDKAARKKRDTKRADSVDQFQLDDEEKKAKRNPVSFTEEELKANIALIAETFRENEKAYQEQRKSNHKARKEASKWDANSIKLRKTLKGHEKYVNFVAYGFDKVASGGDDATVRVWDASSLKKYAVLEGHKDVVRCVLITSKYIISGSDDGTVKMWGINSLKTVKTFRVSTGLGTAALAISSNERILISASDTTLQMWDLLERRCLLDVADKHKGQIASLVLAGQHLFTGSAVKTINLWDLLTCTVQHTVEDGGNWVYALALCPDRELLVSGSSTIKVWDISNIKKGKFKLSTAVEVAHASPTVQTLAVTDDENYVVSASMDGFIKIWPMEVKKSSKPLVSLENKTKFLFSVSLFRRRIFTAERDGVVRVWE